MSAPKPSRSRRHNSLLAACLLALPWTACSSSAAPQTQSPFDEDRAWRHLETVVGYGVRSCESEGLEKTRQYLLSELKSYGLEPVRESFREETPFGEKGFANVYADIGTADAPLVIICTHIDTKLFEWEFIGANDSGSGTAALLELARCLANLPANDKVTYRVLFLDGEESLREKWLDPDNRYGSRYHAGQLVETGEIPRTKACILLDLIGDKELKLTSEAYSDSRLRSVFFNAAKDIGLGDYVNGPTREILDDHLSFMAVNIPSLDLIDYEYGPDNAYWHDPRDTIENVSKESLGVIGRIVLAGLPALEDTL